MKPKTKEKCCYWVLAIKKAIKYYWLIEQKFSVFTNHKSFENLIVRVRIDEEIGVLENRISQFNFIIKCNPDKENIGVGILNKHVFYKLWISHYFVFTRLLFANNKISQQYFKKLK